LKNGLVCEVEKNSAYEKQDPLNLFFGFRQRNRWLFAEPHILGYNIPIGVMVINYGVKPESCQDIVNT